jgi:sRNA-binding protein
MTSQHRPTELLKILKEELPLCFKKGNDKIPLMQGIHHEVIEYYKNDTRFNSTAIRHAIRFSVSSNTYLKIWCQAHPELTLMVNALGLSLNRKPSLQKSY